MKKVLTILLGFALVLSLVCVVGADQDIKPTTADNATTNVEFSVDQSYTVTIPSTITIDPANGMGNDDITATIYRIDPNHNLNVTLSAEDGYYNDTGFWVLQHTDKDDDTTLPYFVNVGGTNEHVDDNATESPVKPDTVVLSVSSEDHTPHSVYIHCRIMNYNNVEHSGSYQGKLKFTVTIEPATPDA